MLLKDKDKLKGYMLIQGVSARELADGAGLASHGYLTKLLRGEAQTVKPETAARLSLYLGVGLDDLWLAKSSGEAQQAAKQYATHKAAHATASTRKTTRKAVAA